MLKLDNNLLDELGLGGLPEEQKRAMLQHIYDTLELRVGTNLANQMTDQQLEEFEKFIDSGGDANQAQALQWLETNLPNYKQVVNDVFEALKVEIKQMAPQIMAASIPQQQSAQPSIQQPVMQAGQPLSRQAQPQAFSQSQPHSTNHQRLTPSPQTVQQDQVQDATVYQFPVQQPPAGPGSYQQQSPYYSDDRRAA